MLCPAHLSAHAVGPAQLCMADLFQALLSSPAHTCTKAGVLLPPTQQWCCILPKEDVQVSPLTGRLNLACVVHRLTQSHRSCAVDGLSEQFSAKVSSSPISPPLFWHCPSWREPCLCPGLIPECPHRLLPFTACPLLENYQLTPLCVQCD